MNIPSHALADAVGGIASSGWDGTPGDHPVPAPYSPVPYLTIFHSMRHVYVHVPFCRRRCIYCDFAIAVRRQIPSDEYVQLVDHRLETDPGISDGLRTLYLGGGTPSLLPPRAVTGLVTGVLARIPGADGSARELTLEANPDDVTLEAAREWAAAGLDRVSLGAQSFDDHVLRWMHRTHDAAAIEQSVGALRRAGIESLSLDLIFGLPEEVGGDFANDLSRALALEPDHVSTYGLTLEQRTPLGRWVARGSVPAPAEERYEREFLLAHEMLVTAGFEHYEVSSYARPGHRAVHNANYWTGQPYTGLGPAAHSLSGSERRWNVTAWAAYRRAVTGGRDPTAGRESLDLPRRRLERVYLGLRTAEGIPAHLLEENEVHDILEAGELQDWISTGADRVRLTPRGWLRLDELAGALTTSAGGG